MEEKKLLQYKEYFDFTIEKHLQKNTLLISEIEFLAMDLRKFIEVFSYNSNILSEKKEKLELLNINIKKFNREFSNKIRRRNLYTVVIPFYSSIYRFGKKEKETKFVKDKLHEIKNNLNKLIFN